MVPRHVVLDQAGADRMITTVQNRVFHSIAVVLMAEDPLDEANPGMAVQV
jgi:hypothetical protein